MKEKWISIAFCLLCALLLIGCGSTAAEPPAPETTPAPSAAPSAVPSAAPSAALPDEALKPDVTETSTSAEDVLALAKSFEGKPLSELIAAVGEPVSSDYVSSCLGSGQDGELKFDGFVVVTYREGSDETVTYVKATG